MYCLRNVGLLPPQSPTFIMRMVIHAYLFVPYDPKYLRCIFPRCALPRLFLFSSELSTSPPLRCPENCPTWRLDPPPVYQAAPTRFVFGLPGLPCVNAISRHSGIANAQAPLDEPARPRRASAPRDRNGAPQRPSNASWTTCVQR